MRRLVLLLTTAAVAGLATPTLGGTGTEPPECDRVSYGPPPSYYVCRDSGNPGPLDDCYGIGVLPLAGHPIELRCN